MKFGDENGPVKEHELILGTFQKIIDIFFFSVFEKL